MSMKGIVTLTTDFGDMYPAAMKGVILSLCDGPVIVDVSHDVEAGNIAQGAFMLRYASGSFPAGTVHVAVVDPEVGGARRAIVLKGEKYTFIGPDNGLLMPAAREQGAFEAYQITNICFFCGDVSPVFHGRDVFAPAAAFVLSGKNIPGLKRIDDPIDLDFGRPAITDEEIVGRVIFVDPFGNAITNIDADTLTTYFDHGNGLDVNGKKARFVNTYCEGDRSQLVVIAGSHGMAEIAVYGNSAAKVLCLKENDRVRICRDEGKKY